jgi:hypothetical protein
MKTIFHQKLTRTMETSEETINVAVEVLSNSGGFYVSSKGMKTDWKETANVAPIVSEIQGNPFSTAEIAIGVAKEIVQIQINSGFRVVEVDGEPPSSQGGGFQTHIRMTPPSR